MKKRIISCILTVLILASVLPANAFADSSVIHRQIHINPLYKDVVDQKQLFSTLNGAPRLYSDTQPQEAGSADEAAVIGHGKSRSENSDSLSCRCDHADRWDTGRDRRKSDGGNRRSYSRRLHPLDICRLERKLFVGK